MHMEKDRLTIFEFYGIANNRVQRPGGPVIQCDGCQRGLPTYMAQGSLLHKDHFNRTNNHFCTKRRYTHPPETD